MGLKYQVCEYIVNESLAVSPFIHQRRSVYGGVSSIDKGFQMMHSYVITMCSILDENLDPPNR